MAIRCPKIQDMEPRNSEATPLRERWWASTSRATLDDFKLRNRLLLRLQGWDKVRPTRTDIAVAGLISNVYFTKQASPSSASTSRLRLVSAWPTTTAQEFSALISQKHRGAVCPCSCRQLRSAFRDSDQFEVQNR
jgi:hypothetical protein